MLFVVHSLERSANEVQTSLISPVVVTDLERVQSRRGGNTVFGDSSRGFPPPDAQRGAPPPPQSTEGKAYVGFSVQQAGDPFRGPPEFVVANVTAESTADQKGLQQGDRIQTIDDKDVAGMHEEEVKQMLIGEPFSVITIVTASKTVEIERDCAVPEPEAGGPIVGGMPPQPGMGGYYSSMPPSYGGGFQTRAMPMQMQYAPSPPRLLLNKVNLYATDLRRKAIHGPAIHLLSDLMSIAGDIWQPHRTRSRGLSPLVTRLTSSISQVCAFI